MKTNAITNAYSSFSGADSLAFMILPNTPPILMGSLTTISYSIYRDKKPVTLIGRISTGGFTRGSRVCAGTMIFTLLNQHWINDLLRQVPWLKKYGKIKADELPIFDVMIISANEYGSAVKMFILGIDFTDEGQVLSVEDMFTENQFSFIARDVEVFDNYDESYNADTIVPKVVSRVYRTFPTSVYTILSNSGSSYAYTANTASSNASKGLIVFPPLKSTETAIKDNLYLNSSNMVSSDDVTTVQELLIEEGYSDDMTSGVYDTTTYDNVKSYQSENGLPITGILDDTTYNTLIGSIISATTSGSVVYKDGAPVYASANLESGVVTTVGYNENIVILSNVNGWIKTKEGYIPYNYIYSYDNVPFDYLELRSGDTGADVLMLQESLNEINGSDNTKTLTLTSVFDSETVSSVMDYQVDNNLPVDGIVNDMIWSSFKTKLPSLQPQVVASGYGYSETFISIPGTYSVESNVIDGDSYGINISNITKDSTVKITAIAHYADETSKSFHKTLNILTTDINNTLALSNLQQSMIYNQSNSEMPDYIEFIIYSKNNKPYKWNININN